MNEEGQYRRRRGWILGAVLMVLGVIVVVPAAVKSVLPFVDAFTGPKVTVPGERQMHLSQGDYDLYERTAGEGSLTSIAPSAVTVTASDGTTVLTRGPGNLSSTIEHGSATYTKAARFTVPHSGDYDVLVSGVASGEVMVVRSFGSTFRDARPWIGLAGAGGLVFVAGGVVLLVSLLRRGSARVPAQVAASWPAAWYPDPHEPGALRYWNGRAWTEHTHRPGAGS